MAAAGRKIAIRSSTTLAKLIDCTMRKGCQMTDLELHTNFKLNLSLRFWGAIHQLLSIILKLRILVLLPVSTMPYVVIVKNYS
jgi:hypothetical protein